MTLHPQAQALFERWQASGTPPLHEMGVAAARAWSARQARAGAAGPDLVSVQDRAVASDAGAIGVRVYEPSASVDATIVYLHGGGWALGTVEGSDASARRIAEASGARVVSVEYRLAPEHPYPAGIDDAFAALCWAAEHFPSPGGLVVAGDSAGGALAAACARRAHDAGGPALALQVLIYPILDHDLETPSYAEHGEAGYILSRSAMAWFWDLYAPASRRDEPDASPLRALDLQGLAPALVLVADHDVLRDEGLAYARRLQEAGVDVELVRYPDMMHGFFAQAAVLDRAADAVALVGDRVRALSARRPA